MGAYLSSPVRDKESRDFDGHCLSYGASSMQGWRMTQEDAHSCQVDFDKEKNSSLFAVYDGHGGAEVAQYSSMHFPNYLKNTSQYAKGLINEALEEAFLGFDATLTEDIVIRQLKELAGVNNDGEEADEEVKNEAAALCEEASMPLEKVLERYGGQANAGSVMGKSIYSLRKRQKFQSPLVRTKADKSDEKENPCEFFPSETDGAELSPASSTGNKELDEVKTKLDDKLINGFCENEADRCQPEATNGSSGAVTSGISAKNEDLPVSKGREADVSEISDVTSTSDTKPKAEENGDNKAGSGSGQKVTSEPHGPVVISSSSKMPSSNKKEVEVAGPSSSSGSAEQPGADKEENSDEDTEDEDEPDSEEGEEKWASENEDDDSDDDVEGFKFVGDDDEDDDEEDDDDDDIEDEEEEEEEEEGMNAMSWNEEPGVDSGCTAVVALLRGRTLYVANAGDSRCVLSRGGVAVEMSSDHKPEDDPERERIVKAGGKVTCDGRVNGGLNLSRALGDHGYKQNASLGAREQMITALPDIRTITLTDKDNFMVLACDGIWNVMSSQQVVEFVQKQFDNGVTKLSSICEEMFETCLAPDTAGDGTGCDNMTCIIVRFNGLSEDGGADASKKRRVESAEDCSAAKRTRAESCENSDDL